MTENLKSTIASLKYSQVYKYFQETNCKFTDVSNDLRSSIKLEFKENEVPQRILNTINCLESVLEIAEHQFDITINCIIAEIENFILEKEKKSFADKNFDEIISKLCREIRGNESKILDDYCKAYLAAESKMTGKDILTIFKDISLNIKSIYEDGFMKTQYWFSAKEQNEKN